MEKTYIIAEIGINHNGDLNNALKLIDIAAASGCDAVKFQKRTPELAVPESQKNVMRDTPWGKMKYIDYKFKVEFKLFISDDFTCISFEGEITQYKIGSRQKHK